MKANVVQVTSNDKALLEQARAMAGTYRVVLDPREEGGFIGSSTELPRVFAVGSSLQQCVTALQDALTATVAMMLKAGETPPVPASRRRRVEQINIRVTPDERTRIEDEARAAGFRGVSDFVRNAVLARLNGE